MRKWKFVIRSSRSGRSRARGLKQVLYDLTMHFIVFCMYFHSNPYCSLLHKAVPIIKLNCRLTMIDHYSLIVYIVLQRQTLLIWVFFFHFNFTSISKRSQLVPFFVMIRRCLCRGYTLQIPYLGNSNTHGEKVLVFPTES